MDLLIVIHLSRIENITKKNKFIEKFIEKSNATPKESIDLREKKKKIVDEKIDEGVEIMIRVARVHGYPFLLTDHSLRRLRGLSNIVLSARIDFAAIVTPASNLSRQARLDLLTFILKLEP